MKDIAPKLIPLFKEGYCTPQIARIAKKIKEPSTTIHYNIKKLEKEGKIKTYKAVFDYEKIEKGFCTFALLKLDESKYGNPEEIGKKLASMSEIESVDIITGDYEMIIKIRVKDQEEYYKLIKKIGSIEGVTKTFTLMSFKQLKTEFIEL
tara:strand:+ start:6846 stop:7295 length:450 start_codon:yes stop_codon:yes gene_type:complete